MLPYAVEKEVQKRLQPTPNHAIILPHGRQYSYNVVGVFRDKGHGLEACSEREGVEEDDAHAGEVADAHEEVETEGVVDVETA